MAVHAGTMSVASRATSIPRKNPLPVTANGLPTRCLVAQDFLRGRHVSRPIAWSRCEPSDQQPVPDHVRDQGLKARLLCHAVPSEGEDISNRRFRRLSLCAACSSDVCKSFAGVLRIEATR